LRNRTVAAPGREAGAEPAPIAAPEVGRTLPPMRV
jgi:hypothetical protein